MADAGTKKNGSVASSKETSGLDISGPEIDAMLASQRKNVEAIMQASQVAIDAVQAVWRRQLNFVQEAVAGFTILVGGFAQPTGPSKGQLAKHAEYSKQALEKNLANVRELTELATRATSDAMSILNQRVIESLEEVHRLPEKPNDRP
jgi:phasin family protein